MNYLKYFLLVIISIPLFPIMLVQALAIRRKVPKLPEAKDKTGTIVTSGKVFELITIGESTIAGVGVKSHKDGFTGALAQELSSVLKRQVNWEVFAKSGYTARKVAEDIIPSINKSNVDLIVIGLGGNDAFKLNAPWTWKSNIRALIDGIRLKYPNAPICLLNMPPIKEFPAFTELIQFVVGNLVEIFGEELNNLVRPLPNVFYFPTKISLDTWHSKIEGNYSKSDFFSDGVHPSSLTYRTWAKFFGEFLFVEHIVAPNKMTE